MVNHLLDGLSNCCKAASRSAQHVDVEFYKKMESDLRSLVCIQLNKRFNYLRLKIGNGQPHHRYKPEDETLIRLSLHVPHDRPSVSMHDLLTAYFDEEDTDDFKLSAAEQEELQERYPAVSSSEPASQQYFVTKLPKVLFLNPLRYRFVDERKTAVKINTVIDLPDELDMSKFMKDPAADASSARFRLFAVIVHRGRIDTGIGHYTIFAFVKSAWHELDGSNSKQVDISIVREFSEGRKYADTNGAIYIFSRQ